MRILIAIFFFFGIAAGFLQKRLPSNLNGRSKLDMSYHHGVTLDDVSMLTSLFTSTTNKAQAKGEFFFFFFGGSGALGIGGAQIPKLLEEYNNVQKLGGSDITQGGPDLEASGLATIGYPEKLKQADIQQIIDEMPDMQVVLDAGPKRNFLAKQGYLEREGLAAALPQCNPLALYAVFDAMSKGGGDMANPAEAAEAYKNWKDNGLQAFASDLTSANGRKYAAFGVFFFLIFIVLELIVESGINAFL